MIRAATRADVPSIVRLTEALHGAADMRLPLQAGRVASFAASLVNRDDALTLIAGDPAHGMLCASIESSPLSEARLAVEHGWYCPAGGGIPALRSYVEWARAQGAWGARLSTPGAASGRQVRAMKRLGFRAAETAWVMEF